MNKDFIKNSQADFKEFVEGSKGVVYSASVDLVSSGKAPKAHGLLLCSETALDSIEASLAMVTMILAIARGLPKLTRYAAVSSAFKHVLDELKEDGSQEMSEAEIDFIQVKRKGHRRHK